MKPLKWKSTSFPAKANREAWVKLPCRHSHLRSPTPSSLLPVNEFVGCRLILNQHQHAVATLEVGCERLDLLATLCPEIVGDGKEVAVLTEPLGYSLRLGAWRVVHHDGMHARPELIRRAADDLDRIVSGKLE